VVLGGWYLIKQSEWLDKAALCILIFILVSFVAAFAHDIGLKQGYDQGFKEGYRQYEVDLLANRTQEAEIFVEARWEGNYVIHNSLAGLVDCAEAEWGEAWFLSGGVIWSEDLREATVYYIDRNGTLHVFYFK